MTEPRPSERQTIALIRRWTEFWIEALRLQHQRALDPRTVLDTESEVAEIEVAEIDLEFFAVALRRLRRVAEFAITQLPPRDGLANAALRKFDHAVPDAVFIRDKGEHFDDYAIGKRRPKVEPITDGRTTYFAMDGTVHGPILDDGTIGDATLALSGRAIGVKASIRAAEELAESVLTFIEALEYGAPTADA